MNHILIYRWQLECWVIYLFSSTLLSFMQLETIKPCRFNSYMPVHTQFLDKRNSHTKAVLELKRFYNNFLWKLLLYAGWVGRNICIGTTWFLSVLQAITIRQSESCLKVLQFKAPKYFGFSVSSYWVLYIVANIFPSVYI